MISRSGPGGPIRPIDCVAIGCLLSLSAIVMALARDNAGLAWFGWVGLIPLLTVVTRSTPARGLAAGALWGSVCGATVLTRTTMDGGLGMIALVGVIVGVFALVAAAVTRRLGPSPYLVALGWIGVEVALRPLGWQDGLLAATQADGGFATSVGETFGYAFIAFAVVYVNAWLVRLPDVIPTAPPRMATHGAPARTSPAAVRAVANPHRFRRAGGSRAPPSA